MNLDDDALAACVDLVGRTGARDFTIGYLHDNVPVEEAGWYAHAQYRGARISVEDHRGPVEAADALCRRLLTGAQCKHCKGVVALSDVGAVVYEKSTLLDGTSWNVDDTRRADQCRWRRLACRWVRGCEPDGIVVELEQAVREGDLERVPDLVMKLALQDRERARRVYAEISAGFESGLRLGRQQRRNLDRVLREPDGRA